MHSVSYTSVVVLVILHVCQAGDQQCKNILQGFLVGQEVTSVGYKNLESMKAELKKTAETIRNDFKEALEKTETDLRSSFSSFVKIRAKSHIIYTRWGRKDCPEHAELLYTGSVGGSHYSHGGGAAESLCLPMKDPRPQFNDQDSPGGTALVYGAEYEVNYLKASDVRKKHHDHDVPCAVCKRRGKSVVKMFPALSDCPGNLSKEYNGTLMAGHHVQASATQYTCIDKHPQMLTGGHANRDGRLFYTVTAQCGSLRCPPYQQNKELTCVVCSL